MSRLAERGLLARNTIWNLAGQGAPLVVALIALPIITRNVDAASFGVLGLAWIVFGFATELGFGRATTKFAAEHVDAEDGPRLAAVAWTTLAVQLAFGGVAALALALAARPLAHNVLQVPAALEPHVVQAFIWLAIAVPFVVLGAALRGLLEALQRFDLVNLVRAPATAANYAAPAIGALLGWSVDGMVALVALTRVLMSMAYGWQAVRAVPDLMQPRLMHGDLKRIIAFGGWTSISGTVSPLLITLDRFFLGAFASVAAVGYFTAPYELAARMLILPASLVATLLPAFSALDARGQSEQARALAARATRRLFFVLGPVVALLILTAPFILGVWVGEEYAVRSSTALRILAVGVLINALAHVPDTLLRAVGRPDLPAKFHMLELPIHAGVAAALITAMGVTGAALAWTLRVSLDAVLLFTASRRVLGRGDVTVPAFATAGVVRPRT